MKTRSVKRRMRTVNKRFFLISALAIGMSLSAAALAACGNNSGGDTPGTGSDGDSVYTVTFNSNGGSAVASVDVAAGQSINLDDYITDNNGESYFYGWYLDAELSQRAPAQFSPSSDVTLYAAWGAVELYTLSFDSCGGSAVEAQQYTAYEYLSRPADPQREGYRFDGWYWDAQYSKEFIFKSNTMLASDITVYAKWVKLYTLTFETNGSDAIESIVVEEGTAVSAPADPVRENYVFDGWFADEGLTQPYIFGVLDSDATIYAAWHALSQNVQITFDLNSPVSGQQDTATGTGIEGAEIPDDGIVENFQSTVNSAFVEEGESPVYIFGGWSLDAAGMQPVGEYLPHSDSVLTLYAQWTRAAGYVALTFADDENQLVIFVPKMQGVSDGQLAEISEFYGYDVTSFVSADGTVYDLTDATFNRDLSLAPAGNTQNFEFVLSSVTPGYMVTGFSGSETQLIIPSTYNGMPVTAVAENAFSGNTEITSVTLPDNVTYIGANAFGGCTALSGFTGGKYVKFVGEGAFAGSSVGTVAENGLVYLDGENRVLIGYRGSSASITIPSSVTTMAEGVFADNLTITSVTFANGSRLSAIPAQAFAGCVNLADINFSAAPLNSVGESAFEGCTALSSASLPSSVTEVGAYAFSGCTSLEEVSVAGVRTLGQYAFENCAFTTLDLTGLSLSVIPEGAFSGCASLGSIVLPSVTSSIGANAFEACVSLVTVTVNAPENSRINQIGANAFSDCTSLRTVILFAGLSGDDAAQIGEGAFDGCASDLVIFVADGTPSYDVTSKWYDEENDAMPTYVDIYSQTYSSLSFLAADMRAPVIEISQSALKFSSSQMSAQTNLLEFVLSCGVTATDNATADGDIVFSIDSVRRITPEDGESSDSSSQVGTVVEGENGIYDMTICGVYNIIIRATDRFGNSDFETIKIAIVV